MPSSLDECIRLILVKERDRTILSHQLGTLYAHVRDKKLYTQKGFDDFWTWVEKGIGRTRDYVRKLLSLVDKFPNEKDVGKIGSAAAQIIATVKNERTREKLVREAKQGATAATIKQKVTKINKRKRAHRLVVKKPGPAPKFINVDTLIRARPTLQIGKPVMLVPGVNVELRRLQGGRLGLKFSRSK